MAVATAAGLRRPTDRSGRYRPLSRQHRRESHQFPEAPSRVPISIAAAEDFDPDGADHAENPELVPLAIDGDLETAWQTVDYRTPR